MKKPKTTNDGRVISISYDAFLLNIFVYLTILVALTHVKIEPVGRWFESYCTRRHHKQTLSSSSQVSSSSEEGSQDLSPDEEEDNNLMLTLDPKDWKVLTTYFIIVFSLIKY